ncbi:hypothetical protein B4O97_17860 [Marispirochaeta aestuarii]|uniref:HTH lacI-type domain-containing protein n=1 Tax=Marispirochaeta aestuarii TaxID=1963862 RepID=A0A1Y1RTJ5_9SPIO|nr:LacI family DNA-binding transcriptional regulator [Marispirochaeta aestuarii]ORC30704.1 hypothetical protein B4O97_17860 [Marispirochaeta aestuarii]
MNGNGKRDSLTLKDIAHLAGVSVGTASKVINGVGNVSLERRIRVEAVIEKLGYRPSALARSIKRRKTMVIGLIIPKIKNAFYIQIIDAIEKLVQKKGYTLFLGNSDENLSTEIGYLQTFAALRVDGLILASAGRIDPGKIMRELDTFKSMSIPVVSIVRQLDGSQLDTVLLDNVQGAYEATKHVLEMGHRRIAIISSPEHTSASRERIEGYSRALEEYKLPYTRDMIKVSEAIPESGYRITKEIIGMRNPPTALFVASNYPLIGSLQALRDTGRTIPDDISLICFDDPEWSPYIDPPLTAVHPNTDELCTAAVNTLMERINGDSSGQPVSVRIPTQLIVRKSVRRM